MAVLWQSSSCRVEDVWVLNVQIFVVRRVGSIVYMTVAGVLLVVPAHVNHRLVCWSICCARRRLVRCPAPRTRQYTASMGADHRSDDGNQDHSTERDANCQTEANAVTRRSWRSCNSTTHIRADIYGTIRGNLLVSPILWKFGNRTIYKIVKSTQRAQISAKTHMESRSAEGRLSKSNGNFLVQMFIGEKIFMKFRSVFAQIWAKSQCWKILQKIPVSGSG